MLCCTSHTVVTYSSMGTGDLTMKSEQLREALAQNPKLMQDMKQQLRQVFYSELQRWDVHPVCIISSCDCSEAPKRGPVVCL